MKVNPHIKPKNNSTSIVMLDVIIALLPLVVAAYIAYGQQALLLIATAIVSAILADFLFSALYARKFTTVLDGSAVITALLLSFTLSPVTAWYVVAFGGFSAVIFGKMLWGGLGKNRFNPALVGREFMAAFFPVMASSAIWDTKRLINIESMDIFGGLQDSYLSGYLSDLIYKPTGAMGEYSIALIALGGLYLILRKRISWHIPFMLLAVFSIGFWLVDDGDDLKYSIAGVLLGSLFMATDMPSSPNSPFGKMYYGGMIGLVSFIFIAAGVRFEYMSFSILILNGFSSQINDVFRPRVWGREEDTKIKVEKIFLLTLTVLAITMAVLSLHYYQLIHYLVYIYIIYIIFKFNFSFIKNISNPI